MRVLKAVQVANSSTSTHTRRASTLSTTSYHSDADTADLVPAWGIEAVTRAYLKIIDSVNRMEIGELLAQKGEPPR